MPFFCTFPRRNSSKNNSEYSNYPSINFNTLFEGDQPSTTKNSSKGRCSPKKEAKFRCLFHYFDRITEKDPLGNVTICRRVLDVFPFWEKSSKKLRTNGLELKLEGSIEDQKDMTQVDFANKRIGGGVLGWGAVQEEIRFLVSPELIISRLLVEQLASNESVILFGPERYCEYEGYAETFSFKKNYVDTTPRDTFLRRKVEIIAIDALKFTRAWDQFTEVAFKRELNKAFAGFCPIDPQDKVKKIATGLWGCGAFGGNFQLKAIIQLMASSVCDRDMLFFTYQNEQFHQEFSDFHFFLQNYSLTIGDMYKYIKDYCELVNGDSIESRGFDDSPFEYCAKQIKKNHSKSS